MTSLVCHMTCFIVTPRPQCRWQKVELIMFEKEKGNTKINRLRIIDKYEVDYNLLLKIYWPKITNNIAEKNNTLGKNQLGTKKKEFDRRSYDQRIYS